MMLDISRSQTIQFHSKEVCPLKKLPPNNVRKSPSSSVSKVNGVAFWDVEWMERARGQRSQSSQNSNRKLFQTMVCSLVSVSISLSVYTSLFLSLSVEISLLLVSCPSSILLVSCSFYILCLSLVLIQSLASLLLSQHAFTTTCFLFYLVSLPLP